jgi:hypothetical protein
MYRDSRSRFESGASRMQSRNITARVNLLSVSLLFIGELGSGQHDTPFPVEKRDRLYFF